MMCCGDPGVCTRDGTIPVSILFEHCFGHTNIIKSKKDSLCEVCLDDVLMDSQWSVGWKRRAEFLYGISPIVHHPVKKIRDAYFTVFNYGITQLMVMCIDCNKNIEKEGFIINNPFWETKRIQRLKKMNVPKECFINHEHNLFCDNCQLKIEKRAIKSMAAKNLPLYIDNWITDWGVKAFDERLKKG